MMDSEERSLIRPSDEGHDRIDPTDIPTAERRGYKGLSLGLGAFVLLAGALALGGWSAHEQQRQVAATAEQHRDFVPNVRVAEVKASNDTVTVSLPGTTSPYTTANIFAPGCTGLLRRN